MSITIFLILIVIMTTLIAGLKLQRMFKLFRLPQNVDEVANEERLPSVSLCIPARNETHAMTDCLQRALASDYPKLEIIVLDDGSRDDTALLIKSFAHAGVRFVEGSRLPDGWLGKNYALKGLAHEASGKYLLFADVDTRLKTNTISQMVEYMQHQNADMVSVLPLRFDGYRASVLFTTLRQFWSILFHQSDRPAVASNAWLVKRSVIVDDMSLLEDVRQEIRPDAAVARHLMKSHSYRFLISSPQLGVSYEKKWQSQVETSVRLAFPLLGRNWFSVFLTCFGLSLLLLPFVVLPVGIISANVTLVLLSLAAAMLMVLVYAYYLSQVWARGWMLGMWLLPIVIIQEICLVLISAIQYGRGTVTWKGRPVAVRSTN